MSLILAVNRGIPSTILKGMVLAFATDVFFRENTIRLVVKSSDTAKFFRKSVPSIPSIFLPLSVTNLLRSRRVTSMFLTVAFPAVMVFTVHSATYSSPAVPSTLSVSRITGSFSRPAVRLSITVVLAPVFTLKIYLVRQQFILDFIKLSDCDYSKVMDATVGAGFLAGAFLDCALVFPV